jgi:hypothetical protein
MPPRPHDFLIPVWLEVTRSTSSNDAGQYPENVPVSTRLRRLLTGLGMVAILAVPNIAAKADFGPWHFTVTAAGNREFHEIYPFPSRRACEAQRDMMLHGVARVLAEHGSTTVGRVARRLHLSPCEVIRQGR